MKALQQIHNGKKTLAIEVADSITQESFETDLSVLFDALKRCSDKAFS